MTPPPTSIDGTDITGATIDGQDVEEITIDGNVVFSAAPDIPDAQNLVARYDARNLSLSDGQTVNTWPDEVGNADLSISSGTPTYVSNGISGVPSVDYDGNNDSHSVVFGNSLSEPFSVFLSARLRSLSGFPSIFNQPTSGSGFTGFRAFGDFGQFSYKTTGLGDTNDLGAADTNPHILSNVFANNDGTLRVDSSFSGSGLAATENRDLEGIRLASRESDTDFCNLLVTEVLVYSVDESSNQVSIENYLDRDLGLI